MFGGNDGAAAAADDGAPTSLFLLVGLGNGTLVRTEVDGVTGRMGETRRRFLDPRSVRLAGCLVRGKPAVLALSSRMGRMSALVDQVQARVEGRYG